jgi:hypothetical protein
MNMIIKMLRPPNTDGWGNKLVTIFARHLDNFIVTIKFSILYQTRDFGSRQILHLDNFLVRRDGKNCAIPSLHRDSFLAPLALGIRMQTGWLRRVTFTPSTAGPLGVTE